MRNPALRAIGFGAAALTFVSIIAFSMTGEAKRQALVKADQARKAQVEQMRARATTRAPVRYAADEDWRSPQEYDSVRYQPESRSYDSDYRDVAYQRDYYQPRPVLVESDDSSSDSSDRYYERAAERRRTEAEADRLTRQLDSRLYER